MNELTDVSGLGFSEAELFAPVSNDSLSAEKITAPRYSYWHSVFRVFFRKKINIVVLVFLVLILLISFVMPIYWPYDPMENVTNGATYHMSPNAAMRYFGGFSFKWLLGSGGAGLRAGTAREGNGEPSRAHDGRLTKRIDTNTPHTE